VLEKNRWYVRSPTKLQTEFLSGVLRIFHPGFQGKHPTAVQLGMHTLHQNRIRHPVQTVFQLEGPQTHNGCDLCGLVPVEDVKGRVNAVQDRFLRYVLFGHPAHYIERHEKGRYGRLFQELPRKVQQMIKTNIFTYFIIIFIIKIISL
jgi:hypothetical protein